MIIILFAVLIVLFSQIVIYRKLNKIRSLINLTVDLSNCSIDLLDEFRRRDGQNKSNEKKPGANRNPRTEAQRAAASAKRKEWWQAKRAADAINNTQLSGNVSPRLDG